MSAVMTMNAKYHPPVYWVNDKRVSKLKWRKCIGKPGYECRMVMKERRNA